MKGLEGRIRPEGRPGHRHWIEEYAGTAAALHQTHTHTHTTHAKVADVSGLQGCMPMRNAWCPQAHFTELCNGPSPTAREGQHIKN